MQLKQYQKDTLGVLQRFLEEARVAGPKNAYETITTDPEVAERLGRYGGSYAVPFRDMPEMPYVCLRLPTGGGKTILGCHAVRVARDAWVEKDYPVVLWLVPTNTIRLQTVQALKNPLHPYYKVLEEEFEGRVRIYDISEFTRIRPQDLRDSCCIVVGTIQTLRVTNTEGRRVYAHNEDMEVHFQHISDAIPGLEHLDGGGVKFSFANLMHLRRPLMIVDEAHGAVTGLTRATQARLNPCAIIEFTATPKSDSNILYSVSAQELKAEEMIKLPVMLSENDTWQQAVNAAVLKRAELSGIASNEVGSEYIRPIVLFQAQNRNQEVNVQTLRRHLLEVERIPENSIAIATGEQRELDGINLLDPSCSIEYVITVEALKEGWDCSFAYVFCSVSPIRSSRNVEQLFGRVLRMPYAARRQSAHLNKAYAFVSEPSFGRAAQELADKLVDMGFDEEEAQGSIQQEFPALKNLDLSYDLFDWRDGGAPVFTYTVDASPEILSKLQAISYEGLIVHRAAGGEMNVTFANGITADLVDSITAILPDSERREFSDAIRDYRMGNWQLLSPAQRGERFKIPRLMSAIQGTLEVADTDAFMEYHDWALLTHGARLDEQEFSVQETARSFEIDIDGRRVSYQFLYEHEQLALNISVQGWTPENLIIWLDLQVHELDLPQQDLLKWLSDLVLQLHVQRGIPITALTRCKFALARIIRKKLNSFRLEERSVAYGRFLFEREARVEVSFDNPFEFREGMYRGHRLYRGSWKPGKHFLGPDRVPAMGVNEDGEEVQCAQAIDSMHAVNYWVRNISRNPESFWLPTSTDRFYPDFVALLNDERVLVVEYKGAHIAEGPDTAEKRAIGELWQRKSDGKGLFLVVEKSRDGLDMRGQLRHKVAQS